MYEFNNEKIIHLKNKETSKVTEFTPSHFFYVFSYLNSNKYNENHKGKNGIINKKINERNFLNKLNNLKSEDEVIEKTLTILKEKPVIWIYLIQSMFIIKKQDEFQALLDFFDKITISLLKTIFFPISSTIKDDGFIEKVQHIFENNSRKICDIIKDIYNNQEKLFPKNIKEIDIYDDKFKKICNSVVLTPFLGIPMSGVFIIHIYYLTLSSKYDIEFVWKNGSLENDQPIYTEKDRKVDEAKNKKNKQQTFFQDKKTSYLSHLSKDLNIDFKNINKSRHKPLWKILDVYKYYINDIGKVIDIQESDSNNLDDKKSDKKSDKNKSRKTSIIDLLESIFSNESFDEIPSEYRKEFFYSTYFCINSKPTTLDDISFIIQNISLSLLLLLIIFENLSNYIRNLMSFNQYVGLEYVIEYENIIKDFEQWLEMKLKNNVIEDNEKSSKLPKITAKDQNLYDVIQWRRIIRGCYNFIEIIDNTLIFNPNSISEKALRLYLATLRNKNMGVSNWKKFKENFGIQIESFFNSYSEEVLKEAWLNVNAALLFIFNEKYNFPVTKIKPHERITEQWLEKYADNVRHIKVDSVFTLMHIFLNSTDLCVETQGSDTIFFKKLVKKETSEESKSSSRIKDFKEIIKRVKSHYTSKHKPDNSNVLTFCIIRLLVEQQTAFFMEERLSSLIREFKKMIIKKFKNDVLCKRSIEQCKKNSKLFLKWIANLNQEIKEKRGETEQILPNYKEFLEKSKNSSNNAEISRD